MDKILLSGMEFYAYHGVLAEENHLGQKFKVDVELVVDLSQAGQTDQLDQSINYAEVYKLVEEVVVGERFKLIEAIAERIAQSSLAQWPQILEITIKVIKPNPPIAGHYDFVAVEIRRKRQ